MKECIAAYDFGTSGVKVALVTLDGQIIAVSEKGYGMLYPQPGFVEQDPEEYWSAVCAVTRQALRQAEIDPAYVKALNFSTQEWNVIPISEDGTILYNAVSWLDGRAGKQAEEINAKLGYEAVRAQSRQPHILWFKEERPDIYEKTKYFMCCSGYLQWRATGVMSVDRDYDGIQPYPHYDVILKASGVDVEKVAPNVQACRHYANLDKKGATELGLCEGTPVFGGCIDVPAAAAGAGCGQAGDAHIYLGSSGWLSTLIPERVNSVPGTYQLPSIDPSLLIYGGCCNAACLMQNWTIDRFYPAEKQEPGYFDIIEKELIQVEPGSRGLIATPWLFGEQFPICDSNIRTTFFNVTQDHNRAYFLNAVREGICYSMLGQIRYCESDCGLKISRLGANGGGALSDHWMQMMADIAGIPVYRAKGARHAGAFGIGVAAMVGLGVFSFSDISKIVGVDKEFEPRKEYAAMYEDSYHRFFELYDALKNLYADCHR
ncbi:xylulokinase [Ruthenibacterium lactatiformans]|uniref:xylulokinase n=1 Tax=Ruthenibacterium lactatiformans TaxID=1550024 RepID=UPI00307B27ED